MALENTIVIVADLGELKVFKIEKHEGVVDNQMKISHSLKLINDENFINGRKKLGQVLSDSTGNFDKGTLEDHNLKTERDNRTIKDIVQDIEIVVNEMQPKAVYLAFPKEHNNELTAKLSPETKAILTKNIAADLVKTNKEKILSHFE